MCVEFLTLHYSGWRLKLTTQLPSKPRMSGAVKLTPPTCLLGVHVLKKNVIFSMAQQTVVDRCFLILEAS